jgi:hypothetical protein
MGNLWILGEPMPTGATIGVANRRLWRLQQHRLRLLSALLMATIRLAAVIGSERVSPSLTN